MCQVTISVGQTTQLIMRRQEGGERTDSGGRPLEGDGVGNTIAK